MWPLILASARRTVPWPSRTPLLLRSRPRSPLPLRSRPGILLPLRSRPGIPPRLRSRPRSPLPLPPGVPARLPVGARRACVAGTSVPAPCPRVRRSPGRPRRTAGPPVLTVPEWATIVRTTTLRSPRVGMPRPAWRTRVRSPRSSAAWPECRSPGASPWSPRASATDAPAPESAPPSPLLSGEGGVSRARMDASARGRGAVVEVAPIADPLDGAAPTGPLRPVQDVGHIPDTPLPAGLRAIAARLLVNVVALGCVGTARIENPKERI